MQAGDREEQVVQKADGKILMLRSNSAGAFCGTACSDVMHVFYLHVALFYFASFLRALRGTVRALSCSDGLS